MIHFLLLLLYFHTSFIKQQHLQHKVHKKNVKVDIFNRNPIYFPK